MKSLLASLLLLVSVMCCPVYAGPEMLFMAVQVALPANEPFTSSMNGWTGTYWSWGNSGGGQSGTGGMVSMNFIGGDISATLTKTITALRPCTMKIYTRFNSGGQTAWHMRNNGGAWVDLPMTLGPWLQSNPLNLVAGDNTIEIAITTYGGSASVDVDTFTFQ